MSFKPQKRSSFLVVNSYFQVLQLDSPAAGGKFGDAFQDDDPDLPDVPPALLTPNDYANFYGDGPQQTTVEEQPLNTPKFESVPDGGYSNGNFGRNVSSSTVGSINTDNGIANSNSSVPQKSTRFSFSIIDNSDNSVGQLHRQSMIDCARAAAQNQQPRPPPPPQTGTNPINTQGLGYNNNSQFLGIPSNTKLIPAGHSCSFTVTPPEEDKCFLENQSPYVGSIKQLLPSATGTLGGLSICSDNALICNDGMTQIIPAGSRAVVYNPTDEVLSSLPPLPPVSNFRCSQINPLDLDVDGVYNTNSAYNNRSENHQRTDNHQSQLISEPTFRVQQQQFEPSAAGLQADPRYPHSQSDYINHSLDIPRNDYCMSQNYIQSPAPIHSSGTASLITALESQCQVLDDPTTFKYNAPMQESEVQSVSPSPPPQQYFNGNTRRRSVIRYGAGNLSIEQLKGLSEKYEDAVNTDLLPPMASAILAQSSGGSDQSSPTPTKNNCSGSNSIAGTPGTISQNVPSNYNNNLAANNPDNVPNIAVLSLEMLKQGSKMTMLPTLAHLKEQQFQEHCSSSLQLQEQLFFDQSIQSPDRSHDQNLLDNVTKRQSFPSFNNVGQRPFSLAACPPPNNYPHHQSFLTCSSPSSSASYFAVPYRPPMTSPISSAYSASSMYSDRQSPPFTNLTSNPSPCPSSVLSAPTPPLSASDFGSFYTDIPTSPMTQLQMQQHYQAIHQMNCHQQPRQRFATYSYDPSSFAEHAGNYQSFVSSQIKNVSKSKSASLHGGCRASVPTLNRRRRSVIVRKPRPFACDWPGCEKTYMERCHLTEHLRTHTGSKPFVCAEPGCTKKYSRAHELTRHNYVHTKQKNFLCWICGKTFIRSDHMSKHIRTIHRNSLS